jgi:putative phosphoesterase|tara:strand:- start:16557 stop:17054 length:498 start_codon:yes stop_codon:yes gene_type:complete
MTKIGLLSDTHGYLDPKVFDYFKDVDEIWHAGDIGSLTVIDELRNFKSTRIIFGNIDEPEIRSETKETEIFTVEKMKVVMTHIAGRSGRYAKGIPELLEKEKPNIFVCGHSHILLVQHDKRFNTLWLNPGACGIKGFHSIRTLLRFSIEGGKVTNMEAIEIGKRI